MYTNDYPVTIFRKDYDGRQLYSFGLSKKNQDGTYTNGYMPCQFKKGEEVQNKTKIYIKQAWLKFYLKDKETKPYIFINEYETIEETIEKAKEPEQVNDPFTEYGESIEIDDSFLD